MNLVLIIMYHHLSSLFVIFFGTCGINYRKLVKKQSRKMTEIEGKNEVRQLIDRLDLSLIQLGPVGSREFAAVMPAACQLRQDMNAK